MEGEIDIAETVAQRIRFQEEKRQRNIGAVVGQAAAELEGKEVQDHEPDHDWTARFFNEVQDVSSEEMQVLWARILAGEVERPGNTSIQTLSILRNMARRDAELFVKFCGFCWNIGRVTPLIYDVESEIYTNHGALLNEWEVVLSWRHEANTASLQSSSQETHHHQEIPVSDT